MPNVYIIILNWNGYRDTMECLESVFRLRYPDFRVVVCDNASTDGSIERIKAWARGEIAASVRNQDLAFLTVPPVPKPIPFKEISVGRESESSDSLSPRLILIRTGGNLGFAGGNNVGLRYALAQQNCDYAWLLNNDTVVDPNALSALAQRMQQRPDAAMCGSTLLYYDNPRLIQALGGRVYNRWTGRGTNIGFRQNSDARPDCGVIESRMNLVMGASMLVRRPFLEQIGLMNEAYFLFFEEIDWAARARGKYSLAYAPQSVVYHREGSTIGSVVDKARRSTACYYYSSRSCMLFTKQYFPLACLSVAVARLGMCLSRYSKGDKSGARAIFCGLSDSLRVGRRRQWPTQARMEK
jgi:hypothetical protein